MTKTTNYQLPKWEKTDRVQMKDFNDMTATLDEALHGLAVSAEAAQAAVDSEAAARTAAITALENKSRFTKLGEWTLSTDTSSFEISLANVDWSQWDKVHLDMITTNGSQRTLCLNDTANRNNCFYLSGSYSNAKLYHPRVTFYPAFQAGRYVYATYMSNALAPSFPYNDLLKLVVGGDAMPAGAEFVLWGEK